MGTQNVFGYEDPHDIENHEERVIFFVSSGSCFGQPIEKFESKISNEILGDTITVDCSGDGMSTIQSQDEELLLNSLWVIEYECLKEDSKSSLFLDKYLEAWIPSRTEAVVWTDDPNVDSNEFKQEMHQSYNIMSFTSERDLVVTITNHLTHLDPGKTRASREELFKWTEEVTEAIRNYGS